MPRILPYHSDFAASLPFILLYEADLAAILPLRLLYEANFAANLLFIPSYESHSVAIVPFSLLYESDFVVILPCLPLYEPDSALILACYEADPAAILLLQLRNSGTGAGRVPLCGLNTASPLRAKAVLEAQSRNAEFRMHIPEAVSASAKRSMRPPRVPPGPTPAHLGKPPLAAKSVDFFCILLYFAAWSRFCLRSALQYGTCSRFCSHLALHAAI